MRIVYEGQEIEDSIGPDNSRLKFCSEHPTCLKVTKTGNSVFYGAGVYQLLNGPPVLVLPWFLKEGDFLSRHELLFFDLIREVREIQEFVADLEARRQEFSALDLICHSFLLTLQRSIAGIVAKSFHEEVSEEANVIRGRWHLEKDLQRELRPVKFTCTYGSVHRNNSLLRFFRGFLDNLSSHLSSDKNGQRIGDILRMISDVDSAPLNEASSREAREWMIRHRLEVEFAGALEFAHSFLFGTDLVSSASGICYQLPMDKFFEDLIFALLRLESKVTVNEQHRDDLLGGAVWKARGGENGFADDQITARQQTIPDIVAYDDNSYMIFECKYKPLRVPFINEESPNESLRRVDRNDRNQILSFLMSIRPSSEMARRNIYACLVFPCVFGKNFGISELCFEWSKIEFSSHQRSIIQRSEKISEPDRLAIRFIGIEVCAALEAIRDRNLKFVEVLLDQVCRPQKVVGLHHVEGL